MNISFALMIIIVPFTVIVSLKLIFSQNNTALQNLTPSVSKRLLLKSPGKLERQKHVIPSKS